MRQFQIAAALVGVLAGAFVAAPPARAQSYPLIIVPGMAMRDILRLNEQQHRQTSLRRAWIEAGHTTRDTTAPIITQLSLVNTKLNPTIAPATPKVKLAFTTGSAGINAVDMDFYSTTTEQFIEVSYTANYGGPIRTSGTVFAEQPFGIFGNNESSLGLYAAPGAWTLAYAIIYDNAGNDAYYDGSSFANDIFTVTNARSDVTPPVVSAGKVLTPTVSASAKIPTFSTKLTVGDDLSGVSSVTIEVEPPGDQYPYGLENFAPSPILSGTIENDGVLLNLVTNGVPPPTGTWTIAGYRACDVAFNCVADENLMDIKKLFGTTTFVVTQ